MKGPARWIALVTILGVVAAACSGNGGGTDPSAGSSVEPAKGGTLHIGVSSEPASAAMDPAKEYYSLSWEQMRCCLLRTLYSTNGQALAQGGLELRPDLAASLPEVSEDGLTYTFAIKPGVKFAPSLPEGGDHGRRLHPGAGARGDPGGLIRRISLLLLTDRGVR